MTLPSELPAGAEPDNSIATLAALRREMATLEEQLAAVSRRQAALRAALDHLLARFPEAGQPIDPSEAGQPTLQRCAADVLRVLGESGRPLGTLEILEELAVRHLSWRENTVRHALAELKNEGVVREGERQRPLSYSLAPPRAATTACAGPKV
jgi:hypothetical protein